MAAECFYARNNQQQGPVTWEALQAMAAAGQLQRGDLVWRPGMGNWQPAGEIAGLLPAAPVAPAFVFPQSATPAQPAPFAAPAPVAQTGWQGPSMGGIPTAPPTTGFAPSAGYAPSPLGYGTYEQGGPSQRGTA